jgi:methylthioribose-1-phosphate isomerase
MFKDLLKILIFKLNTSNYFLKIRLKIMKIMNDSMSINPSLRTVEWKNNKVVMIDQTKLPNELIFVEYDDFNQVANAISTLVVRGAPAIGVSGAFGLGLAVLQSSAVTKDELLTDLEKARQILFATRPTAVNLGWGLEKIMNVAKSGDSVEQIRELVISKAKHMADEDIEINKTMGKNGSVLFDDNDTIMTHCNAGALATVAYGTALGVIRATRENGKNIKVIATETRPIQQGSRLTAFELKHDGFDVSLIPDTAVGYSMANGLVNKVVVGADRIVKTGHVFNKIGTYQVATMAKQHGIPFYVAAPLSTIDLETKAENVIIEMRKGIEVTGIGDKKTAPDDIEVINPAFDMTPPELISGIITEKGVATAPYEQSIPKLFEAN